MVWVGVGWVVKALKKNKKLEFLPPDQIGFRVLIQACYLLAVQGGTILAARLPAWPIARRIIALDPSAFAEGPMATPNSR